MPFEGRTDLGGCGVLEAANESEGMHFQSPFKTIHSINGDLGRFSEDELRMMDVVEEKQGPSGGDRCLSDVSLHNKTMLGYIGKCYTLYIFIHPSISYNVQVPCV